MAFVERWVASARKRNPLNHRSYRRQYAGFRVDGPRVYAAFLCRELHAWEWDSRPYHPRSIAGGGDCFFEIVFGCGDGVYSDFATSD